MAFRCKKLGINLSTEDFCPAVSAPTPLYACGQATCFCPSFSADDAERPANIDLAPLRAELRERLGREIGTG